MHILVSINDVYTEHLMVMLASLFVNNKHIKEISVHVLHAGLLRENTERLSACARLFGRRIEFHGIDVTAFSNCNPNRYISKEAYFRIAAPSILHDLDKVLYLDSDIVVERDLSNLWDTCIDGVYVAAVESVYGDDRKKVLGIPIEAPYFNSGVLLINLDMWRRHNVTNKVLSWIEENPGNLEMMDQDALNACLYGHWLPISHEWNYTSGHYHFYALPYGRPAIVHFTGGYKPWHKKKKHPLRERYFIYKEFLSISGLIQSDPMKLSLSSSLN